MAYRYRSVSNRALSFLKSTIAQNPTPKPIPFRMSPSSPSVPRTLYQLGSLQSLLPLYSAVSSARLTSCLGVDSRCSRSLSQELGLSVPR